MSYDESDAARDAFYDEVYEQVSKEAVENFTAERFRSFYDRETAIAEKPYCSLVQARALILTTHHTAAFLHAAIASEVMLRGVVLKPIIYGFIHSDSIAPLIVELAFGSTGLERIKKLLAKIFQDVSAIDLMAYRRPGSAKALWEEIVQIQKRRDLIVHRAEVASKDEAEMAITVAAAVTEELFPSLAKSLGYHLHDGFRLCSDGVCSMPPELKKLIEQSRNKKEGK